MQVTRKQVLSIKELMRNLEILVGKGYASIKNVSVLYNDLTNQFLYVRYDKADRIADTYGYERILVQVDRDGNKISIEDRFADMFALSAFVAQCKMVDLNNLGKILID